MQSTDGLDYVYLLFKGKNFEKYEYKVSHLKFTDIIEIEEDNIEILPTLAEYFAHSDDDRIREEMHVEEVYFIGFESIELGDTDEEISVGRMNLFGGKIGNIETELQITDIYIISDENEEITIASDKVVDITISGENISHIDVFECPQLFSLSIYKCPKISFLKIPQLYLNNLNVIDCGIDSLDFIHSSDYTIESLRSVTFEGNNLSETIDLSRFPNLHFINLADNNFREFPRSIGSFVNRIDLSGNPMDKSNEIVIENSRESTHIIMTECDFTDPIITVVNGNGETVGLYIGGKKLRSVKVTTPIQQLHIYDSPKFTDLSKIDVYDNTEVHLESLAVEKLVLRGNIEFLSMFQCNLLAPISELKANGLKELEFEDVNIDTFDLPQIPTLHALSIYIEKSLSFNDISFQPNLRKISVSNVKSLGGIEKFPNLEEIEIWSPLHINKVIPYLDFIKKLKSVKMFVFQKEISKENGIIEVKYKIESAKDIEKIYTFDYKGAVAAIFGEDHGKKIKAINRILNELDEIPDGELVMILQAIKNDPDLSEFYGPLYREVMMKMKTKLNGVIM